MLRSFSCTAYAKGGLWFLLLVALLLTGCQPRLEVIDQLPDALELSPDDVLLVLAPHPDDEVLGTGGVIQDAVALGIPVHLSFLTYGDANQWSFAVYRREPSITPAQVRRMGEVRRGEAEQAAALLGVPPDHMTFLGYPDYGTLDIWTRHWGSTEPARGLFTRAVTVPYTSAYRTGAAYKGEEILQDLTELLSAVRPTKIFVSHPADTNPDHRALYLFLRVALWDLSEDFEPEVYPFLVHYPNWPVRKSYLPQAALTPPFDLLFQGNWLHYPLSAEQSQVKLGALRQHRTQYQSNPLVLRRYLRANELFGDLPVIALAPNSPPALLSPAARLLPSASVAEELNEEQEEAFVELSGLSIQRLEEEVLLKLRFSRPLEEGSTVSLFVFGYRPDRSFAEMPKLRLRIDRNQRYALFDQRLPLASDAVQVERQLRELTATIPLELLDNPDRLLIASRSTFEGVTLDQIPWRIVQLADEPLDEPL